MADRLPQNSGHEKPEERRSRQGQNRSSSNNARDAGQRCNSTKHSHVVGQRVHVLGRPAPGDQVQRRGQGPTQGEHIAGIGRGFRPNADEDATHCHNRYSDPQQGAVRSRKKTRSSIATNKGFIVTNTSDDNTEVMVSDVTHRAKCSARNVPARMTRPSSRFDFRLASFCLGLLRLCHFSNGRSTSVDNAGRQNVVTRGSVPASFTYVDVPETPKIARTRPAQARPAGAYSASIELGYASALLLKHTLDPTEHQLTLRIISIPRELPSLYHKEIIGKRGKAGIAPGLVWSYYLATSDSMAPQ